MLSETRARFEWPTWAMLVAAYGTWAAAGYWLWPVSPVGALLVMATAAALHSSLQHEILHGHPTRNSTLNEALVYLPLAMAYPYRRFKELHLRHHRDERLTDPYDDPESFYMARRDHQRLGKAMQVVLAINNTLIGRVLVGPALMVYAFATNECPRLAADQPGVRRAWLHHAAGLCLLISILELCFHIPVTAYMAAAYGGMSIIAVRTFCEHQWSAKADGRTIIVENSRFLKWLFLNNNLHFVHHKRPRVPWYRLPAVYAERREQWQAMNDHYVCSSYLKILSDYAFRAKEPVVHPSLRRDVEPGHDLLPVSGSIAAAARQQVD